MSRLTTNRTVRPTAKPSSMKRSNRKRWSTRAWATVFSHHNRGSVAAATVVVAADEVEDEAEGEGAEVATSIRAGLREENLRVGDASPALSGVSETGSPAHSVVNGDDIERWTRRQRMQRLKVQKRGEAAAASGMHAENGSVLMNGEADADAVMDDQVQHGWMQRVT